jgi:calcium permeable stress-gated cation channel
MPAMFFLFLFCQEAMEKDNLERASEPNLNLKSYLANAYLHPIFHLFEVADKEETIEVRIDKAEKQHQHHAESHVRSSSHYHEETHLSTHETTYYHEESQYHEGIHVSSGTDLPSPPHYGYH